MGAGIKLASQNDTSHRNCLAVWLSINSLSDLASDRDSEIIDFKFPARFSTTPAINLNSRYPTSSIVNGRAQKSDAQGDARSEAGKIRENSEN